MIFHIQLGRPHPNQINILALYGYGVIIMFEGDTCCLMLFVILGGKSYVV